LKRTALLLLLAACGAPAPVAIDAHEAIDVANGIDANCPATIPGDPVAIGAITNIGSTELSGLAASHTLANVLWTHGDSGGDPVIYSVDATTAAVGGTLSLTGATNTDWEDIATAPCAAGRCIYVSDTGDNKLGRSKVSIYEVAEPSTSPLGVTLVADTRYEMTYPDGSHNVESLFIDPRDGKSYVITKVTTPSAVVYEMPRIAGTTTTAIELATLDIPSADPRVTAADMFVDGCSARILIRSHDALYMLTGGPDATVASLLASPLVAVPVAIEPQGEAVAFRADGHAYFTTSEGTNPTLWRVDD
jgi:hypothetical protein